MSGILEPTMQDAVTSRLLRTDIFSGWGLRTLSTMEVKYNPMSYHDGTIWPHDNAIIVEGMAATNHPQPARMVMDALTDAAACTSDSRLPELFCGFPRSQYDSPVPYPVSCVPQAWAAGSIFQMLKATLGICQDANGLRINYPTLPKGVNSLVIKNLRVGDKTVNLKFVRPEGSYKINVTVDGNVPLTVTQ